MTNPPLAWLRIFLGVGLFLAGLRLQAASGAEPRVMVQPPAASLRHADLHDQAVRVSQCLSLYLYDWFGAAPDVRLVDERQAGSVLRSFNSPACVFRDGELFSSVRAATPVDALVTWQWSEGKLVLDLHRAGGAKRLTTGWNDSAAVAKALRAVTDFLAAELAVKASTSPLARGLSGDEPQLIEDYYVIPRVRAEWVDNSGEKQVDVLRPYLKRLPGDTWAAAAIVRSGIALSTDSRTVTRPPSYITMMQLALPCLLGTAHEAVALEFVGKNKLLPEVIEKDLVAIVSKLGHDELDTVLDDAPSPKAKGRAKGTAEDSAGPGAEAGGSKTPGQNAGAIRCLGVLRSKAALSHFERIARANDIRLRQAVAKALGDFASPIGDELLASLAGDRDPGTAFYAAHSLRQHGRTPKDLARLAAALLEQDPGCDEAVEVLAAEGTAAVAPRLTACLSSPRAPQRAASVRGLLRLGLLAGDGLKAALSDPDSATVRGTLASLPSDLVGSVRERLVALANHPDFALAESARQQLQAVAPADATERRLFEMSVEHPYVRRRTIAALAKDSSEPALKDLEAACANADPQTRAYALELLSQKAAERARPVAIRLLGDNHRWVRLQAAAVAAQVAGAGDTAPIKASMEHEDDEVTRLYLTDALARAEGHSLPAPRPAANILRPDKTTAFLCGHGADCVSSPIQGYYDLNYNPDAPAREAHAKGKVFLVRSNNTAKNPAQVFLNQGWRDGFWLGLNEEFGDLAALDGVVLGEESMSFRQWNEWESGWRLFCREAGIDPSRVAGDKEKLTEREKQAWWNWEQRVAIEGFNAIYDYVKLRFGKLRPGFQVCTFMPDQNGPCDFEPEWKFDIGAGYYYETNNRHRYTQIRRFKTLWPDRPVLWLCDGAPTGLHTPLNYKYPALQQPPMNPQSPAYADMICAWLAGADPGYFYAHLAIHKDMKPGPSASGAWLALENMAPDGPELKTAMSLIFQGVEGRYRNESEMKTALTGNAAGELTSPTKPADDLIAELDGKTGKNDPFRLQVKAEYDRMRMGLLMERKLLWDCTRLLADLPRPPQHNEILLVGDIRAQTGALRLPVTYDALDRIASLAGRDLTRYRVIAVANSEATPLNDGTMSAVTEWLRKTPGLLVVHGWLNTRADAGKSVIGNIEGKLAGEWPWAKDLTFADKRYQLLSKNASGVAGADASTLVFWQGAGFQGGVVFDASDLAPDQLRDALNKVSAEKKIGAAITGSIGMEAAELTGLKAMVSCRFALTDASLKGVDLLTGVSDPVLAKQRTGALVATEFTGTYAASLNGVSILADQPLRGVKAVNGGLELDCDGLIQAVCATGRVEVRWDGKTPAAIEAKNVLPWLLESTEPGSARVEREDKRGAITYLRARGKVTLTVANGGG